MGSVGVIEHVDERDESYNVICVDNVSSCRDHRICVEVFFQTRGLDIGRRGWEVAGYGGMICLDIILRLSA